MWTIVASCSLLAATPNGLAVGKVANDADMVKQFISKFPGHSQVGVSAAPGRANVIGEHTDYQMGLVTPFALEGMQCMVAYARRDDSLIACYASDLDEYCEFDLATAISQRASEPTFGSRDGDFEKGWLAYVVGAFETVHAAVGGEEPRGCDLVVSSTVPMGAGVSSSSALTVSCVLAARDVYSDHRISSLSLLEICCETEWHYSGVKGGIMDQFASLFGEGGRAIVLDCRTQQIMRRIDLSGVDLLVVNTNVKHELRDSPYAERRAACERVAAAAGLRNLRELTDRGDIHQTLDDLLAKGKITEVEHNRARHGCLENLRVLSAADAADRGDWVALGELVNQAHDSLRDLYEVSCPELDAVQSAAVECTHCYGARMMGGGFGGSVVCVCTKHQGQFVKDHIQTHYRAAFERANPDVQPPPDICVFQVQPGSGAALRPLPTYPLSPTTLTRAVDLPFLWT